MKQCRFWERIAVNKVGSNKTFIITSDGEIFSRRHGIRVEKNCRGYLRVRFGAPDRERRIVFAHRLIWQYFFGDIPDGMQINHKNGIKSDNHPKNLELVTASQNSIHAVNVLGTKKGLPGERNHLSKLKDSDIPEILRMRREGATLIAIAKQFGVTNSNICYITRGKSWRHLQAPN